MVLIVILVIVLAGALLVACVQIYTFFHMARALICYLGDQVPDADTMATWIKWSTKVRIKKLTLIVPPYITPPPRASNYRTGSCKKCGRHV